MTMYSNYSNSHFQRDYQQPQEEAREFYLGQPPAQHVLDAKWYMPATDLIPSFESGWTLQNGNQVTSTQSVDGFSQPTRQAIDQALDLDTLNISERLVDPTRNSEANATMEDFIDGLENLLKPAEEEWKPPMLPDTTASSHGNAPYNCAGGTGNPTGSFSHHETCSLLGSDHAFTFDSGFYSGRASVDGNAYKQDTLKEDALTFPVPPTQAGAVTSQPSTGANPPESQVPLTNRKKGRSSAPPTRCPLCPKDDLKTPSQVKKHRRTHTKPYKCRYPECKLKGIGFATENDRDRHYKSGRHNQAPTVGSKKGFVCHICLTGGNAKNKTKWWPRQDNFKAHCKRRHVSGDDAAANAKVSEIMRRSAYTSRPDWTVSDDVTTLLTDLSDQQQIFSSQNDVFDNENIALPEQEPNLLTEMAFADLLQVPDARSFAMQQFH